VRARFLAVGLFLILMAGLVQPVLATDWGRIFGAVALWQLTKENYKLSDAKIAELAEEAVRELEGKYEVYTDPRVSRIGTELAQKAKLGGVQFQVLQDQEKNAYAVPTRWGNVYITSGYLGTGVSNAGLAFALGHELGHLAKKHAQVNLRRSGERRGVIVGLLVATGANETWQEVASWADFFLGNHYSQQQETKADWFGYELAAAAGYDPVAGATEAFTKLRDGKELPRWLNNLLSTHPPLSDRQKRLTRKKGAVQGQPAKNPSPVQADSTPKTTKIKAVVVLDPQAEEGGTFGFGRGYYYSANLSQVAVQETGPLLEEKGREILLSTTDVGPDQEELLLENSEWGKYGEGRNPIGYFKGAKEIWYVSAYIKGGRELDIGDWQRQGRVEQLTVGVILRKVDPKTRSVIQTFQGSTSVADLAQARIETGRWGEGISIEYESRRDLSREAVSAAVGKALSDVSSYAKPTEPKPATPPTPPTELVPKPVEPVEFLGVGRELILGAEPITLEVRVPKGTAKVIFAVYDARGKKRLEGTDLAPPFSVIIRPEMLRGLGSPRLEARALNKEGRELGRTSVLLIPAQ